MKRIAVGILTHNAVATLRFGLLERTLASVELAFPSAHILVLDNGSTDGTAEAVRHIASSRVIVVPYEPTDGVHTPGRGRNIIADHFLTLGSDLWVFSDDDIEWKDGAEETLEILWSRVARLDGLPPSELALVSAVREPEFPWSKTVGTWKHSVAHVMVDIEFRTSAPAAAWCFPRKKWPLIGPVPEDDPRAEGVIGEDVQVCKRLVEQGHRIGQVALAEHVGQGYSLFGNDKAREMWQS